MRFGTALAGVVLMLALLQGFLSMGFQLVASRLLAPHFGTTLIVWAFLISTFLAAFSAGAFMGSFTSRLKTHRRRVAIAVQGLIGVTFFALVAFAGRPLLRLIETSFEQLWAGLAAACGLLFLIPVAALSAILPVLAETFAGEGRSAGVASGVIYGVSTLGNIAGVMTTAFLLIPNFSTPALLTGWFVVSLVCFGAVVLAMPDHAAKPVQ
ncbi:MAG TPA: fused MFS/spermidine synthase [Hyphomicrobiaceae bacterium]|nr:fused MFS/spermidine synthase [Hyphomicrobiaceae bacterium]